MALINFGYRVDMYAIDPPVDPASFIVAYDLDGVLKQKDHLGVVTLVGAGAGGPQGPPGPVGPAGLTWSGPWIATQSYSKNYAVGWASASWWCISNVTGATSNSAPDVDTIHWALLAAQGSPGSHGGTGSQGLQGPQGEIGINWLGNWIVNVYDVRDAVYYNGSSYVCIASTVGSETISPDTNTACWDIISLGGNTGGFTSDQIDAIQNANTPNGSNPFATMADIAGGSGLTPYQELDPYRDLEIADLSRLLLPTQDSSAYGVYSLPSGVFSVGNRIEILAQFGVTFTTVLVVNSGVNLVYNGENIGDYLFIPQGFKAIIICTGANNFTMTYETSEQTLSQILANGGRNYEDISGVSRDMVANDKTKVLVFNDEVTSYNLIPNLFNKGDSVILQNALIPSYTGLTVNSITFDNEVLSLMVNGVLGTSPITIPPLYYAEITKIGDTEYYNLELRPNVIAETNPTPTLQQVSNNGGFDNGSTLREGSIDHGFGGGISMECVAGYEHQWENGVLYLFPVGGSIVKAVSINGQVPDSSFDSTKGYTIGSIYELLTTKVVYECTDATIGSAVWEVQTQGIPPRMTNAQRTSITSPEVGLIVYCTDTTEGLYVYKSGGWQFIA